jgi:LEA14-like dessication related protein
VRDVSAVSTGDAMDIRSLGLRKFSTQIVTRIEITAPNTTPMKVSKILLRRIYDIYCEHIIVTAIAGGRTQYSQNVT